MFMTEPHTYFENIKNVNAILQKMFLPAAKRKVKENSNTTNLFAEKCDLSLAQIVSKSALISVDAASFLL